MKGTQRDEEAEIGKMYFEDAGSGHKSRNRSGH